MSIGILEADYCQIIIYFQFLRIKQIFYLFMYFQLLPLMVSLSDCKYVQFERR